MGRQGVSSTKLPTSNAVNDRSKTGPIGNRQIYERLKSLKVGEGLTVGRSEWKGRSPPTQNLQYTSRYRGEFAVSRLEGGTGWLIVKLR